MSSSALRMLEPHKRVGLVLVFTGDGKGKTTASLGLVLRSVGHGLRACIIQFIKGEIFSGEMDALKAFPIRVEYHVTGKGFCNTPRDSRSHCEHRDYAQQALKLAKDKMLSGDFDILICDEINMALTLGLLDLRQVIDLIESKPTGMHLVLTGRYAHPDVIRCAHTVTEMKEVKHAYRGGIEAQKGIEF